MRKLFFLLVIFLMPSVQAAPSEKDLDLAKKDAVRDLLLQSRQVRSERVATPARDEADLHDCESGAGSAACWKACTQEGYSSSTCAGRCGTSTSDGSSACWKACTEEGYSSSTCADRCGIN